MRLALRRDEQYDYATRSRALLLLNHNAFYNYEEISAGRVRLAGGTTEIPVLEDELLAVEQVRVSGNQTVDLTVALNRLNSRFFKPSCSPTVDKLTTGALWSSAMPSFLERVPATKTTAETDFKSLR